MTAGAAVTAAPDRSALEPPPRWRGRLQRVLFTGRVPLFPPLVFLATLAVFFAAPLLGHGTFAAVDLVETGAPYRAAFAGPPDVDNPLQIDQVEQLAQVASVWQSLREGDVQLWDPNIAAGTPTGLLPLFGQHSPFNVVFLLFPAWYAVGMKVALTFALCLTGMYLFLRRLDIGVVAATLGAVAYTYNGTNLVLVHRVSAIMVIPALLWATDRLVDQPSRRNVALTAVLLGWCWLEGFPSGFVYAVALASGWVAWRLGRQLVRGSGAQRWRAVRRAGAYCTAGALGVGLVAVSLIPFAVELLDRGSLDARPYGAETRLPTIQAFGLLLPTATGDLFGGRHWTGANPVESVSSIGLIVAACVAVGVLAVLAGRLPLTARGRQAWAFFGLAGAVVLFLSYVGGPLLELVYAVPGIGSGPIQRARFVIALGAAVLAALVLDAGLARRSAAENSWGFRTFTLALAAVPVVILLQQLEPYRKAMTAAGATESIRTDLRYAALLTLAAAALALALLVAGRSRPRPLLTAAAGAGLGALLYAQLAVPLHGFTPVSPVRDFYSEQTGHAVLEALTGDDYRFAATDRDNYYPNSSALLDLPDLRGQALHSEEFKALLSVAVPRAFAQDPLKVVADRDGWMLDSPILDDLAVRYFVLGSDELPLGRPAALLPPLIRAAVDAPELDLTFTNPGDLAGVVLHLFAAGDCDRGRVEVRLTGLGGPVESSRPLSDVDGTQIGFGLVTQDLPAGAEYRVEVSSSAPACRLSTGTRPNPDGSASMLIAPIELDPESGLRLVSTAQGWIYERTSAKPLLSATTRWQGLPTQPDALHYLRLRSEEHQDVTMYVGQPMPGATAEPGEVVVQDVRIEDEHWSATVRSDNRALVTFSQNDSHGWEASIDGRPVETVAVGGVMPGVFVPPGEHTVTLDYRPLSLRVGAALSAACALVLLALTAGLPRRLRRRSAPESPAPDLSDPA